jgi:hypothetical protein
MGTRQIGEIAGKDTEEETYRGVTRQGEKRSYAECTFQFVPNVIFAISISESVLLTV